LNERSNIGVQQTHDFVRLRSQTININASMSNEPVPILLDQFIPVFPLAKKFESGACRECGQEGCLPGRFIADAVSDRDQDTTKLKSLNDDRNKLFTVASCLSERDARIKEFQ
jgi:hypothetical protein